jgi:hypothetical protein
MLSKNPIHNRMDSLTLFIMTFTGALSSVKSVMRTCKTVKGGLETVWFGVIVLRSEEGLN